MADKVKFKVYRGTAFEIDHLPLEDGAVYFAYNTGEIFLDTPVAVDGQTIIERKLMSAANSAGGAAGYVYAAADSDSINGEEPTLIKINQEEYDSVDPFYYILRAGFGPDIAALPKVDTLIINMGVKNTGEFYRVVEVQGAEDRVKVQKIAAGSASGGGGSGGNVKDLYLNLDDSLTTGATLIYGQRQIFNISGRSDTARNVSIRIYVKDEQHDVVVVDEIQTRKNDEVYQFDASILPLSNNITIRFSLTANGSMMLDKYKPNEEITDIKVVEMSLAKNSGFVTSSYFVGSPSLTFNVIGDSSSVTVTPHLIVDGYEVHSSIHRLGTFALSSSTKTLIVPQQEHGVHDVEVYLTTNIGGIDLRTDSLTYQMAWVNTESDVPLIWLDNVPKTVVNYDNVVIKYQVYNPVTENKHTTTNINLLQENELVSLITTAYDSSTWLEWDISSLYVIHGIDDTENHFAISCGAVREDFEFIVTSVGARDLGLVNTNALSLNLVSSGRSNKEDAFLRNVWSYRNTVTNDVFSTNFINFNWFNNGWMDNNDGQGAYLSVANGASAVIDFKPIEVNSTSSTTFELRFRVRNIQEYSTLVTTIARYNVKEDSENAYTLDEINSGYYVEVSSLDANKVYYKANIVNEIVNYVRIETSDFVDNGEVITPNENNEFTLINTSTPIKLYENRKYTLLYDNDGNPIMNEKKSTKETISDKGVCFKYFDDAGYGFCIGTQEAFIKTRAGVANVRYKEDEIINLTFAIAGGDNAHNVYVYLNGILSGAIDLSSRGNEVESIDASSFVINSEYCDFDLYKLRVYSTLLTMPEVIHNYLSDMRDINLYDQNQLTDPQDPTKLLYNRIVAYNDNIKEKNKLITDKTGVNKYIQDLTMPYAVIQTLDNMADLHLSRPEDLGTVAINDDRLPYIKDGGNRYVKITFINPALDEALEKGAITEDFYYNHSPSYEAVGVDINVQGTSSQGYPRRNYKTKFKSTSKMPKNYTGEGEYAWGWRYLKGSKAGTTLKKWHMDNDSCATNKFTWKIDYMESSGSYNTGFANLVGNNLYSKHPLEYYSFDGVEASEFRTSVYGFPVLVFHKHSQSDDLEKYSSTKETDLASIYTYIGRYNLNLDKSANEFYGFEIEDEHPFVDYEWDEEIEDDDGTTSIIHHNHPLIANVAECWELRDNQGTWTSFKYPGTESREAGFGTLQDGNDQLEIIKHFEVRYNADADAIEFCGKLSNASLEEAHAVETGSRGDIDLSSVVKMKTFLREKYANLEALFNWLDSTDTSVVPDTDTGVALSTAEKNRQFEDTIQYMVETIEVVQPGTDTIVKETWFVDEHGNQIYKMPTEKDAQGNVIYNKDAQGYLLDNNNSREELDRCIAPSNYTGTVRNFNVLVSYNTDCAGYRLHKFKAEFSRHLNLEYCIIYFILTELLLCYDSRGKNMMIATWGPQEANGDYIWYPIFYDIDTQLGLNNIGAVLWDYNADATLDGDFSTANSVLWTNLWAAFRPSIEAKYRELRAGKLNETTIEGAYLCNPEVFSSSYAMKGVRPIIALGLDEYYKYILPGLNTGSQYENEPWKAVRYGGFINVDGDYDTNAGYLYTCQGDRKLSRELLIRNRLNYLDSWWLAGSYVAEAVKGGIMIRANANDLNTSDTFLDESLVLENVSGYSKVTYPLEYFDATPKFEITPFLSQYVTVFYDEDPITPSQKYNGINPVITNTTPSVENGYKAIHPYNEQLTYIPGGDFISSLGDLSLKYPSHFTLGTGKRLIDLKLGSDIPGYRNDLLGKGTGTFNLNAGAQSASKKELLQQIILTGISGLKDTIDITTATKLQEFRALGTNIPGVTFAPGAPLGIVHLPATVQGLTLNEAKNLTRILSTKPEAMRKVSGNEQDHTAKYEYKDASTYSGLYIEGITDYSVTNTSELKFTSLNLQQDNLNYDSYKIMDNMIQWRIKDLNYDRNKPLALTLTGVDWCPYSLIGSSSEPDTNTQYYRATDHGTFEEYHYTEDKLNEFIRLRRNEKLYVLDPVKDQKKDYIQDLRYLDMFINDHTVNGQPYNGINCRYRADNSNKYEIPNIQGILYVNNAANDPILETQLDKEEGRYSLSFPNLTIFAKYITPSYIAKFIQEDDVGRENEFWLKRIATNSSNLIAPYPVEIPLKQNYDFVGWSLTPDCYDNEGNPITEQLIIRYDKTTGDLIPSSNYNTECVFSSQNSIITFYAIFELHKYQMVFYNNDGGTELIREEYSFTTREGIDEPKIRPLKISNTELANDEMYSWRGWAKRGDPAMTLVDFTTIAPTNDFSFVAVYEDTPSNVHEAKNILDKKYFKYDADGVIYGIGLNPEYEIYGKITIPNQIDGVFIPALGYNRNVKYDFYLNANIKNEITHVFFESNESQIASIGSSCFGSTSQANREENKLLEYIESIPSLATIGTNAFQNCYNLRLSSIYELLQSVSSVGAAAFTTNANQGTLQLPGSLTQIGNRAFAEFVNVSGLVIGGPSDPFVWTSYSGNVLQSLSENRPSTVLTGNVYTVDLLHIYISSSVAEDARDTILTRLGIPSEVISEMEYNNENANYSWIVVDG